MQLFSLSDLSSFMKCAWEILLYRMLRLKKNNNNLKDISVIYLLQYYPAKVKFYMSIPGWSWRNFFPTWGFQSQFSRKFRDQSLCFHYVQYLKSIYRQLNVSVESLHTIYLKMVFHLFVVWARLTETIGGLYCIVCWLASIACENTNMVHTSICQNFGF